MRTSGESPRRSGGTRTTARRRSRELVLQGLYQRQLSGDAAGAIRKQLHESDGFAKADAEYFEALWSGVVAGYDRLVGLIEPFLDRAVGRLSPIERAILVMGAWELAERPEIHARVAIDEAIELAKAYGGTDGHRFVNGVLDKLAAQLRPGEIAALRGGACTA